MTIRPMTLRLALVAACIAIAVAAFCTVQVNRLDRNMDAAALRAELTLIFAAQDYPILPMADPPGQIIDAALRFRPPACPVDAYVLPLAQGHQTDVYAIRFTELSGALYTVRTFHVVGASARRGFIHSQIQRNLRQLAAAFGIGTVRNGHIVLAVFLPDTCVGAPLPNLSGFWSAQPNA